MALSVTSLVKSNISFMSQFFKKCRKTMENSDMLAPVHYDAKVTPQNPNTILSISHPWCACLSQRRHREPIKIFFLWGSRASHMPYHQKDFTHATRYHGEEPLHTLLMLHFFPLFPYLENKDTAFFYMWKALSTFTLATLLFIFLPFRCIIGSVCAVTWFSSFL